MVAMYTESNGVAILEPSYSAYACSLFVWVRWCFVKYHRGVELWMHLMGV